MDITIGQAGMNPIKLSIPENGAAPTQRDMGYTSSESYFAGKYNAYRQQAIKTIESKKAHQQAVYNYYRQQAVKSIESQWAQMR